MHRYPVFEYAPVLYPTSMLEHLVSVQYPNTPKSTPPYDARGIPLMIGVERTDMRSKASAANSKIVSGVAGLSILGVESWSTRRAVGAGVLQTRRMGDACVHSTGEADGKRRLSESEVLGEMDVDAEVHSSSLTARFAWH